MEVMAALAITGLGIILVLQVFSGALRLARSAEDHAEMALAARQIMAETMTASYLEEGESKGKQENGISWKVSVSPYGEAGRLLKIEVSVEKNGSAFALSSLKSMAAPKARGL